MERMINERSAFPKFVMVSCAVSMLGETSLYIIQQGCSIDLKYSGSSLLSEMIPEMNELANSDYIFQQDGARAHTLKHTLVYFEENLPQTADLLMPNEWPAHSPDLNPLDYGIWSILEKRVFAVKIRDVEHLCD